MSDNSNFGIDEIFLEIKKEQEKIKSKKEEFDRSKIPHKDLKTKDGPTDSSTSPKSLALSIKHLIIKIPIFGYLIRIAIAILKLPKRNQNILNLIQTTQNLENQINDIRREMETDKKNYEQKLLDLKASHKNQADKLNSIFPGVNEHSNPSQGMIERFYTDFEEKFRGPREIVKEKCNIYLPRVKQLKVDFDQFPALDIGCGRGEWLECLKENNIRALGLDLNPFVIDDGKRNGLDMVYADAFSYLRNQKSDSLGMITGFHIVEHLIFPQLLKLFEEAKRVLVPNGMLLFETPNPESLVVGTCNFYIDPTHKNPIPPMTLEFFAEHAGFKNIAVVRHSNSELFSKIETESLELNAFIKWANREQDYAVIAEK